MRYRRLAIAVLVGASGYGCATSATFDGSGTEIDGGASMGDGGVGVDTGSAVDAAFSSDTGSGGSDGSTQDGSHASDSGQDGGVVSDAGGGSDASSNDSGAVDAGIDAGFDAGIDSGTDAGIDAGVDSGTDAGSVGCTPQSVGGFTPTWVGTTGSNQNKCTPAQTAAVYTGCLATGATNATCNAAFAANPVCAGCIFTPDTATLYGPVIELSNGVVSINQAGCVALADVAETQCGHTMQAQTQCEDKSCKTNCPVTDQASFTAYQTCVTSSDTGGCASYKSAATTCENAISFFSNAQTCFTGTTFQQLYTNVVPIFCGP